MLLEVVIVGTLIALAGVSCFLLGERMANARRFDAEQGIREVWENRYQAMIQNGSSERELYRLAADTERAIFRGDVEKLLIKNQMVLDQAAHERDLLLTRIQAWSPGPAAVPSEADEKPTSLPGDLSEDDVSLAEIDKLRAEEISGTLDGLAFVDLRSGSSFESPEEIREWRKYCKANGLPDSTDPRTFITGG